MKKILLIILALTILLGTTGIALAEEEYQPQHHHGGGGHCDDPEDMKTIDIKKVFKLENKGTTRPGETFRFKIEKYDYSHSQYESLDAVPNFDPEEFEITFDKNLDRNFDIWESSSLTLPNFEHIGYYTYKITEIPGDTAGVDYDGREMYLTITVINGKKDGELIRQVTSLYYYKKTNKIKDENFKNNFSAGNLEISKTVKGNMGEKDRYSKVTVNLTAPDGKVVRSPITISGGSYGENPTKVTFAEGETTATVDLYIKHNDTIYINNIPYGVTYSVTEEDVTSEGYDPAKITYSDNWKKKIDSKTNDTVKITNEREKDVATGVNLESLPYIIILIVATGGLVLFALRRRLYNRV